MVSLTLELHPTTPEARKITTIVQSLHDGAVMLYPTDTGFALGCCLSKKNAIERIRRIRHLPEHKHLTFLCDSLTNIAEYAKVSNHAYRVIRRLIPGPFTFVLPATKAVPHYAVDPKRKTTGIRVPESVIARTLLRAVENPLISISAKMEDEHTDNDNPEGIIKALTPLVDVVITSSAYNFIGESTVIDMTQEEFFLLRRGARVEEVLGYVAAGELI
jgi:tRNA threonylcarbamoyl adenosine modification protein (Sua5/YciO/YrdC/YwlC family)